MLKNLNTLDAPKEEFKPIHAGEVSACTWWGDTVYDPVIWPRTYLCFSDVVARYLRFPGYKLKYVRNITDIDDKTTARE